MKHLIKLLFVAVFMFSVNSIFAIERTSVTTDAQTQIVQIQNQSFLSKVLTPQEEGKSQLVALLLAFFLGMWGVHNFYLGHKKKGMTQLLLSLGALVLYVVGIITAAIGIGAILMLLSSLVWLAVWVWSIIDFVNILTGKLTPADGDYTDKL